MTVTIRLPDGEEVDIATDDPKAASEAAKKIWEQKPRSVPGFVGALSEDASKNWEGVKSAVSDPVQTVKNLGKLGVGTLQQFVPGQQQYETEFSDPFYKQVGKDLGFRRAETPEEDVVGGLTWDPQQLTTNLYERPVSTLLSGLFVAAPVAGKSGVLRAANPFTPVAKAVTSVPKTAGKLLDKAGVPAPVVRPLNPRLAAVRELPTSADFKKRSNDIYTAAEQQGVNFTTSAWRRLRGGIESKIKAEGYHPSRHPDAARELQIIDDDLANGRISLRGLEQTRSELFAKARDLRKQKKDTDARQLEIMGGYVDDFMDNAKPGDVAGIANPADAVKLFSEAREVYKQKVKSSKLDELHYQAELDAGANYTSAGLEHALRRRYRNLLRDPVERKLWNKEELAAIKEVVDGGKASRAVGKMAPTGALMKAASPLIGGGIGAVAGFLGGGPVGAAVGSAIGGAAVPAIGAAGRAVATARTARAADNVQGIVRGGEGTRLPSQRHPLEAPTASGMAVATRQQSIDHAMQVLSQPVLDHVKRSPNTRVVFNGWLKARASGQHVDEAAMELAEAIGSEMNKPELVGRIFRELSEARPHQAK